MYTIVYQYMYMCTLSCMCYTVGEVCDTCHVCVYMLLFILTQPHIHRSYRSPWVMVRTHLPTASNRATPAMGGRCTMLRVSWQDWYMYIHMYMYMYACVNELHIYMYGCLYTHIMLCAKLGFEPSEDFFAQSVDQSFAQQSEDHAYNPRIYNCHV